MKEFYSNHINYRGMIMQAKIQDISKILNQYRSSHQIPGLSANMIVDGEVVYSQGFGTPHAESPYNLIHADTLFSIQGITEAFTACALVHLEEHSSFSLDTPVVEYLPYFEKEGFNKTTTAHLLSHTAGFHEDYRIVPLLDEGIYNFVKNMPEYKDMTEKVTDIKDVRQKLSDREAVSKYLSEYSLNATPGKEFYYYSDAYMIAANVLEKVSGLSWEAYVSKNIFEPLGLRDTYINIPHNIDEKRTAKYYMKGIGDPIQTPTPHNSVGAPVGSIYSTAADLSTFLKAQMTPDVLLSETALKKMQASQIKIDDTTGYSLGWKTTELEGLNVISQTGSYPGISSSIAFIPDKNFGLVFLCNTDTIQLDKLAYRMIRRWFS